MYEGIEKMGPVSIPLLIILRSFVFRVSEFRGRVLVVLRVRVFGRVSAQWGGCEFNANASESCLGEAEK